jgi:dUTP pyrophosphatase
MAAGMDVAAAVDGPVMLAPGETILLPTGFAVAIPPGFEIQVRPRSGLAIKHGVTIINSPGTIDADYRGEVKIGLVNHGVEPYTIRRGDRIAQLVVAAVQRAELQVVDELDNTNRQSGGFGHTGK